MNICNSFCQGKASAHVYRMGTRVQNSDYSIALAGNPNTGKSTVFNALTGLKQHTGNWPGKTVARAEGAFKYNGAKYHLIDLPGTYSLLSTSEDEEIARNYVLFARPDVVVIVADASRLERNLNLVLQILQITHKVVLCLNLMDEANRNKIFVDHRALAKRLGIPVIPTSARSGKGIPELLQAIDAVATGAYEPKPLATFTLASEAEQALGSVTALLAQYCPELPNKHWLALRLIEDDPLIWHYLSSSEIGELVPNAKTLGEEEIAKLRALTDEIRERTQGSFHETLARAIFAKAQEIAQTVVQFGYTQHRAPLDVRLDRILTSRTWGFLVMILLFGGVLWLTIIGSNYPSSLLSYILVDTLHPLLREFAVWAQFPWWLGGLLFDGVYLATAWVVSVMLPPMAIFFPLFTLLEDFGYLPRVAFNLDELFRRAGAHGKQALTMAMGFGCNAAGVVSCRIIDSPRERLIAILTNNFSLCNGRWPTQIMIATLFIGTAVPMRLAGTVSILAVIAVAFLGVVFTFLSSWLLGRTVLRGEVSTFHLELPPYRPPRILQTVYTSLIDRTLIVLGRAVLFAMPAGALIWLTCNIEVGGTTVAAHIIEFLDTPGYIMGLNGVILLAYILAIPANEIVIPTVLMLIVLSTGAAGVGAGAGVMFEDGEAMSSLFAANGWTLLTGVNLMLFCLLHNPCSTTIYTIYKETKSLRWTLVGVLLPLLFGVIITILVASIWRLVG